MAAKEKKDLLEPCRYLGCLHILWPVIVYIVQISRPMCASLRIPQGNFICTFYRNIEACNSRVDSHPNPNQNPTSLRLHCWQKVNRRLLKVPGIEADLYFEYRNVFIWNDNWQESQTNGKSHFFPRTNPTITILGSNWQGQTKDGQY